MKYKLKNKKGCIPFCLRQKGFSLVEIIIYLAIFTMLSILVINSFITVMGSSYVIRENISLLEAGINSTERISREIRESNVVDLTSSSLSLNNTDDGTSKRFSKEGELFNLYECSNLGSCDTLSGNLLGPNILLESLVFRRIATTESEAIKIEMSLRDARSKTNKVENFYNTIILRGGY
jgi:type II secretory pathway pseudopilin PulG